MGRRLFSTVYERIAESWLVLRESVNSFLKNNDFEWSATLAYYGFLSLIPLLLLAVYAIGRFVLSSESAADAVNAIIVRILPLSDTLVSSELTALSKQRGWGILTTVILLWSVTPLASSIRGGFHAIFRAERPMSFLKGKLYDILVVLTTLVLFVAIVAAKPVYSMLVAFVPGELSLLVRVMDCLAPLVITFTFMMLFYRIFTPVKLKLLHLSIGAVMAAAILSVMEPVFTLVLKYNPDYGVTFGSLKTIFLFFVWVYYAFAVVLFGAEIMANLRRKEALVLTKLFERPPEKQKSQVLLNRFVKTLNAGDVVFEQGTSGTELFYVLEGEVTLSIGGKRLREMKAGEYFGELAMLLGTPRTATAAASAPDTRLVAISRENMVSVLKENPSVVLALLKEMAARLNATDARMEAGSPVAAPDPLPSS